MVDSTVRGRFAWHDLITTEIPSVVAFYQKVIGWKTQPFSPDSPYLMWVGKSGPVGGVGPVSAGTLPHWRTYISTADIDATVSEAVRLGGAVVTPIVDIPGVGRYAVLSDPQGGQFGVYWSVTPTVPAAKTQPGEFPWHELATTNYQTAFGFYQSLFGWEKIGEHDMGEMGNYFMFGVNGQSLGGMFNKGPTMPVAWCSYTQVVDALKTAKVITKAGGKIFNGPIQVPGGSWIVQYTDPQGAVHAVVSNVAAAKPAAVTAKDAPVVKSKVAKKKKAASKSKPVVVAKKSTKKAAKKKATKKSVAKKPGKKKSGKKKATSKKLKRVSAKKAAKKKAAKKPVKAKRPVAKKKKVARKK